MPGTASLRAGQKSASGSWTSRIQTEAFVLGVFTPILAKHSSRFRLIDRISVGVDRMQRNFEPIAETVEAWQRSELTDVTAKVVIYEAFVEGKLEGKRQMNPRLTALLVSR